MKKIYFFMLMAVLCHGVNAQVLDWDFNGNAGSESSVLPTASDPNIAPTQITRGNLNSLGLANSYNSEGWSTSTQLSAAIASNSYLEFTVEAMAGYTVSLTGINTNFRRTGSGPRLFQWMYSLDGSNFLPVGPVQTYTNTATNGMAQAPIDLSATGSLDDIPAGVTIYIRLYGYNANNVNGAFGLGRLFGNDLSITGTVTPIVVPVKLISLNAANNRNITKLSWLVNCTSQSVTFDMEKGSHPTNLASFYRKTETQARCASQFDLIDPNTAEGTSYYRLKMTDVDGKVSYSHILQINNRKSASAGISLTPTLVNSFANLTVNSAKAGDLTIMFIDPLGKLVRRTTAQISQGNTNLSLTVNNLNNGMYYVKVILPDGTQQSTPMIKQ